MKRNKFRLLPGLFFTSLLGFLLLSGCKRDPYTYAILDTNYGRIKIMLYDSTPKHRDNFIKLAQSGFYDSLLFHRVVEKFVIQTGDPESRNAEPNQILGTGDTPTGSFEIGAPTSTGRSAPLKKAIRKNFLPAASFILFWVKKQPQTNST
ncbi:MAG: peptidylprolyl isomerase [Haliscomenobacter sp.]|nr:peptidylprolyl isomerase [Haliscomenobacter sp.]